MFSNNPFNTPDEDTRPPNTASTDYDSNFLSIDTQHRHRGQKTPRQPIHFRHGLHGIFHSLLIFFFLILLLDVLFDIVEQELINKLMALSIFMGMWSLWSKSDEDDRVINLSTYMPSTGLRILAFVVFVIGELLLLYKISDLIDITNITAVIAIAFFAGIFNLGVLWLLAEEEFIDFRSPFSGKRTVISNYITMLILTIMLLFLPLAIPQSLPLVSILSLIYLLFYAGFFWSYAIFDRTSIQTLERIAISFIISIIFLPMMMTLLNRLGLNPIGASIIIVNFLIATVGFIVYLFRPAYQRRLQMI